MFSWLSRLRLLSVLLLLVLVAPPLGGRWSAPAAAQAARSQTSPTINSLGGVASLSRSLCVAVGDHRVAVAGTLLRTRHGGRSSGCCGLVDQPAAQGPHNSYTEGNLSQTVEPLGGGILSSPPAVQWLCTPPDPSMEGGRFEFSV
jgi:hypothetical protein